jgi:hypothetical protein
MTEGLAYSIFTAAFIGGLAAFALGMVVVAALLIRRNRSAR